MKYVLLFLCLMFGTTILDASQHVTEAQRCCKHE
jgi:hypothetical protein